MVIRLGWWFRLEDGDGKAEPDKPDEFATVYLDSVYVATDRDHVAVLNIDRAALLVRDLLGAVIGCDHRAKPEGRRPWPLNERAMHFLPPRLAFGNLANC